MSDGVFADKIAVSKKYNDIYYIAIPANELNWDLMGVVEAENSSSIKTHFIYVKLNNYYYIFIPDWLADDWNFKNRAVKMIFDREEPKMKIESSVSFTNYILDKMGKQQLPTPQAQPPQLIKDSTEVIEFECRVIVNKNGLNKLRPITSEIDVGWKVGDEIEVWFFKDGQLTKGMKRRVNRLFNKGEAVAIQFTKKQAEMFGLTGKKKVKCFKNIPEVGAVTIVVD